MGKEPMKNSLELFQMLGLAEEAIRISFKSTKGLHRTAQAKNPQYKLKVSESFPDCSLWNIFKSCKDFVKKTRKYVEKNTLSNA